jgi:hypothetical protein
MPKKLEGDLIISGNSYWYREHKNERATYQLQENNLKYNKNCNIAHHYITFSN